MVNQYWIMDKSDFCPRKTWMVIKGLDGDFPMLAISDESGNPVENSKSWPYTEAYNLSEAFETKRELLDYHLKEQLEVHKYLKEKIKDVEEKISSIEKHSNF